METTLTQDEKMLLTHLPSAIGGAMAVAGRSGLFGTGKEMFATSQALLAGAKDYPDNALIRDIVPDVAGDRSAEMEDMRATRDWSMARMTTSSRVSSAPPFPMPKATSISLPGAMR